LKIQLLYFEWLYFFFAKNNLHNLQYFVVYLQRERPARNGYVGGNLKIAQNIYSLQNNTQIMTQTLDVINNAWKIRTINIMRGANALRRARYTSQLLPFLVSARNSGGMYQLEQVRETLSQLASAEGKSGYEAVVSWSPYLPMGEGNVSEKGDYCSTEGLAGERKRRPYSLNKFTGKRYKFDRNVELCKEGDLQTQFADFLANIFEHAYSNLGISVEAEYFAIIQNSPRKYRYIGNLPTLQTGITRYAGESLPLFHTTDSRINVAGEGKYRQDKMRIGMRDTVLIGGFKLGEYARLKGISGFNDDGYDASQMNDINSAQILYSSEIETRTGLDSPMLALERGAFQLVTYARYANRPEQTGRVTRSTVRDPYLGLEWDLITTVEECGAETVTYLQVEINWGLIVNPDCEPNDLNGFGTNAALLYNIVCADTTICDVPTGQSLYEPFIDELEKCDTPNEVCAPTCNVALFPSIQNDGEDYVVTADAVVSQGATVASYAWELNGSPILDDTRVITLDNAGLVDGDVITVTVTDSLGCVAENSITVANGCPNVVYTLSYTDGVTQTVSNGDVVALGSFAAPIGALIITLNAENIGTVDFVTTAGTATGTGAGGVALTAIPDTLENGDVAKVSSATSVKTAGAKSIVFTLASNDCEAPAFSITVTYTITP